MWRTFAISIVLIILPHRACADGLLYQYEADVPPYDESAGWLSYDPCEDQCVERLEDGHFVLEWPPGGGDIVNYHLWIAQPEDPPPPETLWVEWRFRSNMPLPATQYGCDGQLVVKFREMSDLIFMHGDAVVSFSGSDYVLDLDVEEFHTYRYETLDGLQYHFSVDGLVFEESTGLGGTGYHYLQAAGFGDCPRDGVQTMIDEWDFIRYGTITDGESIASSDPRGGFLDPDRYADIDRFTVTFDQPNFVYLDGITVEVSAGDIPIVSKTWRRDGHGPDTLEVVLDRPMTVGETTRFIFTTAAEGANTVEYTLAYPVPASSDWTILVTCLLLLTAATLVFRHRAPASSNACP